MQYFEQARRTFPELPPAHYNHPDLRSFMALGFDAAAFCALRVGEKEQARKVCDEAIAFGPNSASPWTVRGIVTYPGERAVEDFRKAVSLGDLSYFSYYYLAHDALTREEFLEAFTLCQQALKREPSKPIEAQVYGWMAICQDQLRAAKEETDMLFQRAVAADPGNEQVNRNYNLFKESLKSRAPHPVEVWDLGDFWRWEEQYLFDRESRLRRDVDQAKAAKRELNAVLAG
jgi:tetratricopeptide (TPR) repeat protein